MQDFIKNQLTGIIVTIITSMVIFSSTFGGLREEVSANTKRVEGVVLRPEFQQVVDGQAKLYQIITNRMDRLDTKVDTIYLKLK